MYRVGSFSREHKVYIVKASSHNAMLWMSQVECVAKLMAHWAQSSAETRAVRTSVT